MTVLYVAVPSARGARALAAAVGFAYYLSGADGAGAHGEACVRPVVAACLRNARRAAKFAPDQRQHLLVEARSSCLCTLSDVYSFVPRWRPPFISALAPQDRCHLNGPGLRDGRPRYVTAHGRSDAPSGWREQKKDGGILMDVLSNDVILGGLSMPHSARWHEGRLWLLESGDGSIGVVDLRAGRYRMVAELPGFKRGLDFHGPYAFVGLSQVRETAIFGGLALTERLQERTCGVWVIDTRSGQSVAALRFEAGVRAIFAVQVLAGKRYPELITHGTDLIPQSFVLPDESLKEVDPSFRSPPPVKQSGNRDKPADPA